MILKQTSLTFKYKTLENATTWCQFSYLGFLSAGICHDISVWDMYVIQYFFLILDEAHFFIFTFLLKILNKIRPKRSNMPRNTGPRFQYSEKDLEKAIELVKNGESIRKAASQTGVPSSTLSTKLKANVSSKQFIIWP